METRAPFVIVGAFVLAAIGAVFGFVYWLHNAGGLGPRTSYHVQFEGSVPGLLVGAAVLFNGIRVGEVSDLGLAPDNPRRVDATISVASNTPVRADTKVGLEFQGLTGVPVVALEGGVLLASGPVTTLVAEPGAGQGMTQAARDALRRVDLVLAENAEPLKARLIESFENYDIGHPPLRTADGAPVDNQLVTDVRRFQISTDGAPLAEIALSARIIDKDGKVVASRLFQQSQPFDKLEPSA